MDATRYGTIETPWGPLTCGISESGLCRVEFVCRDYPLLTGAWAEAFAAYLMKMPIPDDLPIDLAGVPPFTRRVLEACRMIPFGVTMTYTQLSHLIGTPHASRAVGQALARNPVPIAIPCHRVVGANGRLTGFLGGLEWKRALLAHEGIGGNLLTTGN
ncbi:MAG: methylated-DNA--[protein]-cysteine S-methyltransferase [Armatimonadota bacterium]